MNFNEEKFNQIFLKNLFKEILKEKGAYPITTLDVMCQILASAYLDEFDSDETHQTLIKKYASIEKWLIQKIEVLDFDN